ncbi:MAG: hypothetical protein J5779_02660 [Clostridia bacterium]|nr:hypothetical protein [Clostridia bacterium]
MVWGKIITRLRDLKLAALHIATGDITDIEINGETLIAKTDQEYLFGIISKEENFKEIKNAIKFLGLPYDFKIELKDKPSEKVNKDIAKLKDYVGEYLKIK